MLLAARDALFDPTGPQWSGDCHAAQHATNEDRRNRQSVVFT
jgi:hypothetical protein